MTNINKNNKSLTPLMRQYYEVKDKHPDKILFFRMGDFYEMFGDDAIKAAPILNITLTSRSHGNTESIPLAGVPYHSADKYLSRLLSAGEKVVVVEQVEDPKTAKGLVKRDIVEILTPGTSTIDSPDKQLKGICLASIVQNGNNKMGLAALDLSTGSFLVDEGEVGEILERLKILEPSEIIFPALYDRDELIAKLGLAGFEKVLTDFGEWNFDARTAESDLNRHFGTSTLDGFGISHDRLALSAAGAIFRYLKENYRNQLDHIIKITRIDSSEFMQLDYSTVRNLELVKNISSATQENTLFSIVNRCNTSAGSRRLKNDLLRPFKTKNKIELRLADVTELVTDRGLSKSIRQLTKAFPDLEKMNGRLGIGKLSPRQMRSICIALELSLQIKDALSKSNSPNLMNLGSYIPDSKQIINKLSGALVETPPLTANKGDIFQRGYSSELDKLNDSIKDARLYIGSLQKIERERTGISSLKVGFNKIFGYYIEITKTHSDSAPENYIRKQTLVNAERYITPELKEKEELILNAEEKIYKLEEQLYRKLLEFLGQYITDLKNTADLIAEIDLVSGLAELAIENNYCRPEIYEDSRLNIVNGRHSVIENVLPVGSFVANDTRLNDQDMIQILTGPNMSGKSTYLRQIGLIVILAQIGSYVPADSAEIGLVDRVFTRVGALDNLAQGQSTFLVEMIETSNILHNATERSLVLLDEVGRGTSTFDGMSIAWAVVEYINEAIKARTIFATHYHELTGMAELYPRVHNFQVAVKKWENKVIFLHQIIPGGCDDSYGIEVAKLAGIPRKVISRGNQILKLLESGKFNQSEIGKSIYKNKVQTTLFEKQESEIEKKISDSDLNNLTPIEALNFLKQLKEDIEK